MTPDMQVHLVPACAPCMVHSVVELVARLDIGQQERVELLRLAYDTLAKGFAERLTPVEVSIEMYQQVYRAAGVYDPYAEIKRASIRAAESALPEVERVVGALDGHARLRAALASAVAGNVIDFNTSGHRPDLGALVSVFRQVMEQGFAIDHSGTLWEAIQRPGRAVVLADNAGETLFDVPLLRVLREYGWNVYYAVKGAPMMNDATVEDVKGSEVEALAKVVTTGAWAHGTPRGMVGPEFLRVVDESDVVISKGQANFETFPEIQRATGVTTWYVLRGKCPHIARVIGIRKGENAVVMQCQRSSR